MYATTPEDGSDPGHALAIHDPGRAWFLARMQLLRDLVHDVGLLGEEGEELGKTAGQLAKRIQTILETNSQVEWDAYIQHAAARAPGLADALRRSGPPSSVAVVEYPAEGLKLPTAIWDTAPVEDGGLWFCPGDGTEQGFAIPALFKPEPRPADSDDQLILPVFDRSYVAAAALRDVLSQFHSTALTIMEPCDDTGAWRRLKFLSQHYRQLYLLGMQELGADELTSWDKDAIGVFSLSDAAQKISEVAGTAMAVRLLSLGTITSTLNEWIRELDAVRPAAKQALPKRELLARVAFWVESYTAALKVSDDARLFERKLVPGQWSVRVIQRPYPGSVPVAVATRNTG